MEDYVCTFLQQYAEAGGHNERLAFLVGRHMVVDGQPILFIGGAIHGKYTEKQEGYMRFSENSIGHAEDMLDEHFSGMEIVGWMQSQPSYGTYLNQYYGAYHLRQFKNPHQVLFVMDPMERTNAFYMANPNALTPADRLAEVPGYFIYYEKNKNMHEYMLANKSLDYTAKQPTYVELTPMEYAGDERGPRDAYAEHEMAEYAEYDEDEDNVEGRYAMGSPKDVDPEEIIRRHQAARAKRKGETAEQKRAVNLLASLCVVLFVVSFVMGVGLIRNQDRIERMEGELRQLITAHRNLLAQVSSGELAPAFAETPAASVEEPTPTPTQMPTQIQTETPPEAPPTPPPVQETPEATTQEQPVYQPDAAAHPYLPGHNPEEAIYSTQPEQDAFMPPIPATYTIQPGDSLMGISLRFFGTMDMVQEILALNGIEDADHIVAGRTIALPIR